MPSDLGRHVASMGAGDERLSPGDQRCPPSARWLADAVSSRLIQTESNLAAGPRIGADQPYLPQGVIGEQGG